MSLYHPNHSSMKFPESPPGSPSGSKFYHGPPDEEGGESRRSRPPAEDQEGIGGGSTQIYGTDSWLHFDHGMMGASARWKKWHRESRCRLQWCPGSMCWWWMLDRPSEDLWLQVYDLRTLGSPSSPLRFEAWSFTKPMYLGWKFGESRLATGKRRRRSSSMRLKRPCLMRRPSRLTDFQQWALDPWNRERMGVLQWAHCCFHFIHNLYTLRFDLWDIAKWSSL